MKIGEAAKLDSILHTSNHLFLNKVDHVTGIDYGVVDPSKTMRDDPGATIDTVPIITYHTNAVYYHAVWTNDTIPGTTEKGAYLCTIGPARYYLDAFEPGQNTYRVIVCLFPLPSGAQNPPPPKPDTEKNKGPK